jgi:flagellar biosynthetic protein FliO
MIAALVVAVVLAILVLRYALPRLSFANKFKSDGPIKIVSRMSLGQKQHLYLVKVAERSILLGVTDHSINKIAEFDKPL